jgi:tetratricopeptide (TPR) repeat protein
MVKKPFTLQRNIAKRLRPTALLETEVRHIKVAITPYFSKSEGRVRAAKTMPPNQREFFQMTSKRFRTPLTAALLMAAASLAVLASPAAAAPLKLTTAVNNALAEEQKAEAKGDMAAAQAAIDKAKAVPSLTDNDNYMINRISINVGIKSNNHAAAAAAAEAAAESPVLPPEDKAQITKFALILANEQKHTDKALAFAKTLAATNPTDPSEVSNITVAYYNAKDYAGAQAMLQKQIAADKAAGKAPSRETLQNLLDVQVAQKDEAGAEATLEQLVAQFNDPKDWTQMIDVAISSKGIRDVEVVWLGRLIFLSGATPSQQDVNLFGATASHLTFFGDAQIAAQHGGTGFPDANARADADKKTIPAQIAAEQKQNGNYSAKLAEALYSYGMYPEAEAAAKVAMTKGGATDSTEAPMVLGQALTAQGKYDEAIAAFGQVQGGGPATARITRLWVALANIKKNPPAAAPAAAAAAAPAK